MIPLKYLAAVNPSTPEFDRLSPDTEVSFVPLEAVWPSGVDASQRRPKASVSAGYTRFLEGDILLPKITPTFQADRTTIASGLAGGVGAGTTELHVVRVGPAAHAGFVRYVLSSRQFLRGGAAEMIGVAGQKRVPDSWLREFPVLIEDLATQRAIADYLDTETARIDALIAKKGRLIDVLAMRSERAADAIVLPLGRPADRRSPSDLPADHEVPDDWQVAPLGRLLERITYGFTNPMPTSDEGPLMLTANDIGDGVIRAETARRTTQEAFDSLLTAKSRPKRGDILLTKDGTLGRVALFEGGEACINQSVAVLTPDTRQVVPELLSELLAAPTYRDALIFEAGGTTIKHLYISRVVRQKVALPLLPQQPEHAARLRETRLKHSRVANAIRTSILLLREHRQALITAAVTGELEISGAA